MWTSGIHMLVFNAFTTIKSTIIYYIVANTYIVFALHNELQQDIIHIEKERKKQFKSLFSYWAETHKRIAVQLRRQQIVATIKEVEFFFHISLSILQSLLHVMFKHLYVSLVFELYHTVVWKYIIRIWFSISMMVLLAISIPHIDNSVCVLIFNGFWTSFSFVFFFISTFLLSLALNRIWLVNARTLFKWKYCCWVDIKIQI